MILTETDLVDKTCDNQILLNLVNANLYPTIALREVKGLFGIPDLVILNFSSVIPNQIIRTFAFEYKLSNWKKAMVQAYRYKSFADYSYVIINESSIKKPLQMIEEFQRFNIGLISTDIQNQMTLHFSPKFEEPYSVRLKTKLNYSFSENSQLSRLDNIVAWSLI